MLKDVRGAELGAWSDLMGADTRGSEPMAGDEFEVPMTQASLEARSVFVSSVVESAASVARLSLPSSDGALSLDLGPVRLQAQCPTHNLITDLGHVHRGGGARLS